MKYLIKFTLVIFLFTACESEETPSNDFDNLQIQNVLELKGKVQRNAFVLLSPDLKYKLWSQKLEREKANLNEKQIIVVDQLLKMISPKFFATDNRNKEVDINNWMTKAHKVFKRTEFINTFVQVGQRGPTDPLPISENCGCNQDEDYCWFSDCEGSNCESHGQGCGLLWNSPCNGECN